MLQENNSFREVLLKKIEIEENENNKSRKEFGKNLLNESDEIKSEMLKSMITLTHFINDILSDARKKIENNTTENILEWLAQFLVGRGYNYYYNFEKQKTEKFSIDTKIVGYGVSEYNLLIISFQTNGNTINLPLELLGRLNKEGEGEEFSWKDFFEYISINK